MFGTEPKHKLRTSISATVIDDDRSKQHKKTTNDRLRESTPLIAWSATTEPKQKKQLHRLNGPVAWWFVGRVPAPVVCTLEWRRAHLPEGYPCPAVRTIIIKAMDVNMKQLFPIISPTFDRSHLPLEESIFSAERVSLVRVFLKFHTRLFFCGSFGNFC